MEFTHWRLRSAVAGLVLAVSFGACGAVSGDELSSEPASPVSRALSTANLVITSALTESATSVSPGQTLSAALTFTNEGSVPATLQVVGITSLPPGASFSNGPWKTFTPELGQTTVLPGANLTLSASATFTSADALGTWQLYATYLDSAGTWHASPVITFTVGIPTPDLVISTPLAASAPEVARGEKLSASITYRNLGSAAEGIQQLGITSIPPGGSFSKGPWKTFTPELGWTSVAPGTTLAVAASATFGASDALGTWQLYATYLDSSGTWHDSPVIQFTVVAAGASSTTTSSTSSTTGGAAGGHSGSSGSSTTSGGSSGAATSSTSGSASSSSTSSTTGSTSTGGDGRESWVWLFQNWQPSLTAIASNSSSFTHVSPTLYDINYNYTSGVPQYAFGNVDDFGGLTAAQLCQQVRAAGLKCVPLIYGGANNSGTDQGIQNILSNNSGAQNNFIQALVTEGKAKGYDGWNLDWEVSSATGYATYGQELIAFLSALRTQLHANGMSLSIDIINNMMKQSWCSDGSGLIDLTQIGAVVDSVIDEDYQAAFWSGSGAAPVKCPTNLATPMTCQEDVITDLELLCTYVRPLSAVSVGLIGPTQNAIAGKSFGAIESFGFGSVAVWPNDNPLLESSGFVPAGSTWFSELKQFLRL